MKNQINVVIGDWSDDGHGKTAIFIINSNLPLKQIETAYRKGSKKVGFKLHEQVEDCEQSELDLDLFNKLKDFGLNLKKVGIDKSDIDEEDNRVQLWSSSYFKLYMFICQVGDPNLEYKLEHNSQLRIGGYGLF